jgi:thiaminase/transcriptional activator TenA
MSEVSDRTAEADMAERFSDELRGKLEGVWEAQHQHPFVRGLADGTLEPARFQTWLQQHYYFLVEYARVFTLGAARGPDADTMRWMIATAHGILQNDLLLHLAYGFELGLSREDLAAVAPLPTTRAYTDHLLRTASLGAYVELVAAVAPCLWGHVEIAQRLAGRQPARRYGRWIDHYSGPLAADVVRQARELLDRVAATVGARARTAAEEAFTVSSRYEWMFWEMCWRGESWPV